MQSNKNKIRVWSALELLWKGVPLREALEMYKANIIEFFDSMHTKELYIPAFDLLINKDDIVFLILNKTDLVSENGSVKTIPFKDAE